MSNKERDDLIAAIREAIATDEHLAHHAFVAELIEEKRRKREFWDALKKQVVGWAIISLLAGAGTAAYHAYQWVATHVKP